MSRTLARPIAPTPTNCGPCMSEKQRKKSLDKEIKDILATINFLAKSYPYDGSQTVGQLVGRLIALRGDLK